jgi:molybdopterin/thiamine biosynthesis adenylyltransferase
MKTTSISKRLESLHNQLKESKALYKPVFYHLNQPADLKNFSDLLDLPGITVVDEILGQITEFVKLKSPQKKFSTEELKLQTEKHIGSTILNEYGVWVYYPWSKKLVHVLDKEEFIDVRTSRNQYKITKEERDELATKKIGIVGLSVGQSVSVTLAMERICGELRLADFDLLELTNLNRIRTGVHNLGLAKVYSVAREISEIDPFLNVVCYPDGLTESNMNDFFTSGGKLDLLVEESDGFDIKILSRYKARELGVPVIMEASDKCMVDVERFDLEPERNILHGIVKHLDVDKLKTLKTNEEKIPYMLDILGLSSTSSRLRASMLEMQQTISTWPQLGSAVTMGGGITADVSRRILLNQFTDSGRYYVDIDELIGNKKTGVIEGVLKDSDSEKNSEMDIESMKKIATRFSSKDISDIKEEEILKIIEAATAAPSQGNKQPWKWLFIEKKLFLFKENNQLNAATKEQDILISLGAAIENLIIKASELGYLADANYNPTIKENDLIAVFFFKKEAAVNKKDFSLSPYLFSRCTNRKLGDGQAINIDAIKELSELSNSIKGETLSFVTEKNKIEGIASIVGQIERMRLLNPVTHSDYFKNEIRWHSNGIVREGLAVNTLEMIPAVETLFEVISDPKVAALLNDWQKGIAFEKITFQSVASSSAIGLISMPSNSAQDFINGGRLAQKVWLTATKNNIAFQPICLPLYFLRLLEYINKDKILKNKNFSELKALKTQFSLIFNELDSKHAVFLFRLFHADLPPNRSQRKSLDEVFYKS